MALGNGNGRKVVTTAGTAVALESTPHEVLMLIIQAETDNTGVMAVGGSDIIATVLTRNGPGLLGGDFFPPLYQVDLSKIYLDSTVSGDGVTFFWIS